MSHYFSLRLLWLSFSNSIHCASVDPDETKLERHENKSQIPRVVVVLVDVSKSSRGCVVRRGSAINCKFLLLYCDGRRTIIHMAFSLNDGFFFSGRLGDNHSAALRGRELSHLFPFSPPVKRSTGADHLILIFLFCAEAASKAHTETNPGVIFPESSSVSSESSQSQSSSSVGDDLFRSRGTFPVLCFASTTTCLVIDTIKLFTDDHPTVSQSASVLFTHHLLSC